MTMTQRCDNQTQWRDAMRTEGHSKETIRRRVGTITRIEKDLGKDAVDMSIDEITRWLARYPQSGTRAAYFGDIEAYFHWLQLRGELDGAPTSRIKRPRQPKRQPRPISTDQLYAGLDTATGDVLDWILLGAYQAFRVSDTASVAGENIDGHRMRVPNSKGGSDKTIPLHDEVRAAAARRPRRGWWFPGTGREGHITAHTVGAKVSAHFEAVGVTDFTYHRLRHWCATEMLRAGATLREVQEFMRHEVITSTALYTQVLQEELAVAAGRLPRRPKRRLAAVS